MSAHQLRQSFWSAVRWPFQIAYIGAWAFWLNLRERPEEL